jgi:hypothetical protein
MTKRLSRTIALFGATGAMVIGGAGIAQASHGADDPAGITVITIITTGTITETTTARITARVAGRRVSEDGPCPAPRRVNPARSSRSPDAAPTARPACGR